MRVLLLAMFLTALGYPLPVGEVDRPDCAWLDDNASDGQDGGYVCCPNETMLYVNWKITSHVPFGSGLCFNYTFSTTVMAGSTTISPEVVKELSYVAYVVGVLLVFFAVCLLGVVASFIYVYYRLSRLFDRRYLAM